MENKAESYEPPTLGEEDLLPKVENQTDNDEPINIMENKAESYEPPTLGEEDLLLKVENQADNDEPINIMENKVESYEPPTLGEEDLLPKVENQADSDEPIIINTVENQADSNEPIIMITMKNQADRYKPIIIIIMENQADSDEPINIMENKADRYEPATLIEDNLLPKVENQADSHEPIIMNTMENQADSHEPITIANKADSYEPVTLSEEDLLSKCWICGVSFDLCGSVLKPKGIPYWCTKCVQAFKSHCKGAFRKYSKDILLKCSACNHQTTTDIEKRANLDKTCSACQKPLSIEYVIKRIDGIVLAHKCKICREVFPNNSSLIKHTNTHFIYCVTCGERFPEHEKDFAEHMKIHREKERMAKLCRCSICGKSLPDSESLQSHMEKQHICPMCGKICRRGRQRTLHIRRFHTGEKPYLCTRCGKSFCDQGTFRRHEKLHTDDKPFVCNFCGKRFRVNYNLKVHLLAHTKKKPHQCESCGKCFFHNWQLTNHSVMHTLDGVPKFECTVCFKVFFSMEEKQAHMVNYHKVGGGTPGKNNGSQYPKKKFECVCGKTYTTKASLNEHMYSHTNDDSGKYKCTVCGKDCVSPMNLKQHIKRSHGQKITCPICGKNYAPNSYKRHKLRHLNEKNYTCSVCGKSFLFNFVLTQHMRTHTGEKPYKCPVCNVAFSDASSLLKHKKRVHPELSMCRDIAEFHGLGASPHAGVLETA